jgi:hypothetical protein
MLGCAQLMMRETEIVGASDQIHARLQRFEGPGGMTRSAGQASLPLPERGIQAFDKSGIKDGTSLPTRRSCRATPPTRKKSRIEVETRI